MQSESKGHQVNEDLKNYCISQFNNSLSLLSCQVKLSILEVI
nr:MAG TPA: hypothetical protein [Caudoviricetes sp.]